jgi:SAM-dependent methyltransferase
MGMSRVSLKMLLDEARSRPLHGKLLTLGRQDVWLTGLEVRDIAGEMGVRLRDDVEEELSHKPSLASRGCLSDSCLYKMLGFDEVAAMDASDYEGAQVIFDLNDEALPEQHSNRYDMVLDIGVLEHVFDIAQGLKNVFDLLKVGGRFVAFHPVMHSIDASFYQMSPTLFHDYYTENDWLIRQMQLIVYPVGTYQSTEPRAVIDYVAGMYDDMPAGLDGCYWDMLSIGEKTERSTGHRKPSQRIYREQWELAQQVPLIDKLFGRNTTLRWKMAHKLEDEEKLALLGGLNSGQLAVLINKLPAQTRQELQHLLEGSSGAER